MASIASRPPINGSQQMLIDALMKGGGGNTWLAGGGPDDQLQNMIEGDTSLEGSFQPGEIEPLQITPGMGALEGGGRPVIPKQAISAKPGLGKLGRAKPGDKAVKVGDKVYTSDYGHLEALMDAADAMGFKSLDEAAAKRPDIFDSFDEDSFGHIDAQGKFYVTGSPRYEDYISGAEDP